MNSNTVGRCLALVLVFVTGNGAAADVPLIVPLSGRVIDWSVMQGYSFSVNRELTVTGLGKVDANDNGVLDDLTAPQIGLWNADTSELITSAFIGTDMFFQDQMFVAPIAPIRLPAGRYTVAAQFFNDQEPFLELPEYETPFVTLHDIVPARNLGDTFVLPTGRARMALGPNLLIEQPKVLLTAPRRYSVAQRRGDNSGSIRVEGVFDTSLASSIEVRAISTDAGPPTATPWQAVTLNDSNFLGEVSVPSAGWYDIEARSLLDGEEISRTTVSQAGVGEVFVIAGQSNSANSGGTRLTPESDRVVAMDAMGFWQHAADPQPIATGDGGSPWPAFGDRHGGGAGRAGWDRVGRLGRDISRTMATGCCRPRRQRAALQSPAAGP